MDQMVTPIGETKERSAGFHERTRELCVALRCRTASSTTNEAAEAAEAFDRRLGVHHPAGDEA